MAYLCDSSKFHRSSSFSSRIARGTLLAISRDLLSRDSRRLRDDTLCTESTEELVIYILSPIEGVTIHVNNFRERMYKRTSVKGLKRIVC